MSPPGKKLLETERFCVETVAQHCRDGQLVQRAIIRHPGAVTIVPIMDNGRVCLIRNYRVSVARALIELPAGTLEPGEDPERAAKRELIEETGFRCERFTPLHGFYMSPGILDERMHLFLAEGLTAVGPQREQTEEIENLIVGWAEALEMVHGGEIQDAKTLVGLLLYDRLRHSGWSPVGHDLTSH